MLTNEAGESSVPYREINLKENYESS